MDHILVDLVEGSDRKPHSDSENREPDPVAAMPLVAEVIDHSQPQQEYVEDRDARQREDEVDEVVPPVDVLEQTQRIAPSLESHRDDEEQVEAAWELEALSDDQDEKRECEAYRVFQAAAQEKYDGRTRELQAHHVERVS